MLPIYIYDTSIVDNREINRKESTSVILPIYTSR